MAKVTASVMLDEMSGKAGSVVYCKTKRGIVVRPRRSPANPNTPAQEAVRAALKKAAQAFKNMTAAQVAAWDAYAETQTVHDHLSGEAEHPTAIAVFVKLATKFLQVSPNGTLPLTPPVLDYNGDNLTITLTGGTGKLTFTAGGPNSPNSRTELLVQRLASKNRTPLSKGYRSKGFVQFVGGSLSADVTVTPGTYAAAYRYVNVATGQATEPVALPVSTVSLSVQAGGKKAA